ncbi:hypothetical protein J5N97_005105 [Dioscorea zingiberensis]|uniref:protein-serine/threonine phosphatase n=1 Tax=Dioscorea zingiberensis TaxID=325984 RepID=A0A9D5HS25_9LILI|nr:hypothetical protein J5N97_005105 [Dioscorea zingiberensis]
MDDDAVLWVAVGAIEGIIGLGGQNPKPSSVPTQSGACDRRRCLAAPCLTAAASPRSHNLASLKVPLCCCLFNQGSIQLDVDSSNSSPSDAETNVDEENDFQGERLKWMSLLMKEYLLKQVDFLQDDPDRSLFKLDKMHMLTKLRPFVRTFLEEANHMFEMYVYTMAELLLMLLKWQGFDPSNTYFNSKVISQADCTQRHQKGLDVVLGAESVVVILDDTELVWQKHKDNLIVMERYHYFASSCHQFGFNLKSLSQSKKDESDTDGALANILNVLKRVHQMFFDTVLGTDLSSRDVRQVILSSRE